MSGGISRGHPLVALLALVGGWVGGRAATWDMTVGETVQAVSPVHAATDPGLVGGPQSVPDPAAAIYPFQPLPAYPQGAYADAPLPFHAPPARGYSLYGLPMARTVGRTGWPYAWPVYPPAALPHLAQDFAGIASAPRFYAPEPLPGFSSGGTPPTAGSPPHPSALPALSRPRRWSVDAWALLRRDETATLASPGALPATYGASQAGAVLRYRLALASRYRPTAYLRTTSTTGLLRETSAALGLSARPVPSLPVVAALEARLVDQGGRRRFQPVAMAVTELPHMRLPGGLRAEAYAQAGYVAGRFATPFADGQLRADRALLRVGKVDACIGAGLWGGIQKGAARLDAGPSASIGMPLGRGATGRVSVDWRFRVAGDAVPGSGPAVTLSAGF